MAATWTAPEALGYAIGQLKELVAEIKVESQYHEADLTYRTEMAAHWAQIVLALRTVAL